MIPCDDGTCWTEFLPLTPVLRLRQKLGFGKLEYSNPYLEEKRMSAIKWLREHSSKGWIIERDK